MAYNFIDASQKHVGTGPSINGLRELKQTLSSNQEKNFPALSHLILHGFTTKLMQLGIDCRTLAKRTNDPNVKSSLNNLLKLSAKADEILILEG